jgi:hypothetical protein
MSVEQLASTEGLSSAQIVRAFSEGGLDEYMRSRPSASPADPGDADQGAREGLRISRDGLRRLSSADVAQLHESGALDWYMAESNESLRAMGLR